MNSSRDKVLIRRSRWDAWVLMSLALWAGTCIYVWWIGMFRIVLLFVPLLVILPWVVFRTKTPKEGMYCRTIRGTPGAFVMLCASAAAIGCMVALLVIDVVVLRHPLHAPLEAYHVWVFSPPAIILLAGAIWADRLIKKADAKNGRGNDRDEAA